MLLSIDTPGTRAVYRFLGAFFLWFFHENTDVVGSKFGIRTLARDLAADGRHTLKRCVVYCMPSTCRSRTHHTVHKKHLESVPVRRGRVFLTFNPYCLNCIN